MLKMAVQEASLLKAQRPMDDLRPTGVSRHMFNLYCKASLVSHRAGHVVYEPAGTL